MGGQGVSGGSAYMILGARWGESCEAKAVKQHVGMVCYVETSDASGAK